MNYVIHAYDHTDADALDRRMAVRPAHLDYVRQLKADGQFIVGGALLDSEGRMIGSMLMLDLETDEQLADYLNTDPYIVQGVWDKVDVKPFRRAEV
ncbi:YciI family protein [Spirosoma arcticum]